MEKGNINIQAENIFPIIKKFLYSDHDIFLRELVSNAVDAEPAIEKPIAQGAQVTSEDARKYTTKYVTVYLSLFLSRASHATTRRVSDATVCYYIQLALIMLRRAT